MLNEFSNIEKEISLKEKSLSRFFFADALGGYLRTHIRTMQASRTTRHRQRQKAHFSFCFSLLEVLKIRKLLI